MPTDADVETSVPWFSPARFPLQENVRLSGQSIHIAIISPSPFSCHTTCNISLQDALMSSLNTRTQTHVQCELYVHPGLESPQRHMFERHAGAAALAVISQSISRLVIYASGPQRSGTGGLPENSCLSQECYPFVRRRAAHVVILLPYFHYERVLSRRMKGRA